MKIETYSCDVCGAVKKEVNHWFFGTVNQNHFFDAIKSITITPWSKAAAQLVERPLDGGKPIPCSHICGLECAGKWTQQQLAKLTDNETKPELKGNEHD